LIEREICFTATARPHAILRIRTFSAKHGDLIKVRFQFVAYFSRGHYCINLNMLRGQGSGFLFYAESVATFSVEEMISK
jgi:hypothetical protein